MNKKGSDNSPDRTVSDDRIKYYIQMLAIKQDKNMTRVYSALKQSDFSQTMNKP